MRTWDLPYVAYLMGVAAELPENEGTNQRLENATLETISKPKFGGPWVAGPRWGIHPPNPQSNYLKTG